METINFIKPQSAQATKKEFYWWLIISCALLCIVIITTIILYIHEVETKQTLEQHSALHKTRLQQFQDAEQEVAQLKEHHATLQAIVDQHKNKNANALRSKNIIQNIHTVVEAEQSEITSLQITLKNFDVHIKTPSLQALNVIIEKLSSIPEIMSSMLTSMQTKDQHILATIKGTLK